MPAEARPVVNRDEVLTFRGGRAGCRAAVSDGSALAPRPAYRRRAARPARSASRLVALALKPHGRRPRAHDQRFPTGGGDAAALVEAGIPPVQHLDRLAAGDRFYEKITRRDAIASALAGIEALRAGPKSDQSSSTPSQSVNCQLTESEALPFLAYSAREQTPLRCASSSSCRSTPTTTGPATRRRPAVAKRRPHDDPLVEEPREKHSTARTYRFVDGKGRIGFVIVSEPFCCI